MTFWSELRSIQAHGLSNLGTAIQVAFDLINCDRWENGEFFRQIKEFTHITRFGHHRPWPSSMDDQANVDNRVYRRRKVDFTGKHKKWVGHSRIHFACFSTKTLPGALSMGSTSVQHDTKAKWKRRSWGQTSISCYRSLGSSLWRNRRS